MINSDLALLSIKQRFKVIEQKLNASIIDKQTNSRKDDLFVNRLIELMKSGYSFYSRLSAEKIASSEFGINDKQFVKELAEYAITKLAREYAKELPLIEAYDKLVELYEIQPYSTHQTNVSIDLNQYSTPIPIGYLLGSFIGLSYNKISYVDFEKKYVEYLKNWIDTKDTAKLEFIPINETNWYPTKKFVEYAKTKEFDSGAEKPNFLKFIKNGGLIPPIVVENSVCYQLDSDYNLLENEPLRKCYSIRDGIHRTSIFEELNIPLIPALVYKNRDESMTRDFDGTLNNINDLELFVGSNLKDFYKKYIQLFYDKKVFFEPTAGNGMLTIAGEPSSIIVNEIDRDRLSILKKQGFRDVLNQDALRPFNFDFKFDGIISNPPFGGSTSTMVINGYKISGMDQQIILKSLNYLKDNGRAAFIVGGHTKYDEEGRIKGDKDRAFLSYLAHFYNLVDVINLDGKLYRKQGTSYPIRLIFINGKKEIPNGFFPLNIIGLPYDNLFSSEIVNSFDALLKRYKKIIQ